MGTAKGTQDGISESGVVLGSDPPLQPPALVLQCLCVLRFLQPALSPALQQQRSPLGCLDPGAQRGAAPTHSSLRGEGERLGTSPGGPHPLRDPRFPQPSSKVYPRETPLYQSNLLEQSNPYLPLVIEGNSQCFRIGHLYSCVLQSSAGQTDTHSGEPCQQWILG